jgi:hypothetical protein
VNAELAALLEGHRDVVARRLADSPSLAAFFVELQSVVDQLTLARWVQLPAGCWRATHSCQCPVWPATRDHLDRVPPKQVVDALYSAFSALSCRPPSAAASRPAAFYSSLRRELDAVGWRCVSSLSDDLSQLTLAATDAAGRRHELRLTLPPAYPAAPPSAAADLPTAFELRWGPEAGLADVLAQFEAALQRHQQLWDSLDDLDGQVWVIEPTAAPRRCGGRHCGSTSGSCCLVWVWGGGGGGRPPLASALPPASARPACCALHSVSYRRVALGSHVSLALTLDPGQPGALPLDLRFMGSDAAVAPLRCARLR